MLVEILGGWVLETGVLFNPGSPHMAIKCLPKTLRFKNVVVE